MFVNLLRLVRRVGRTGAWRYLSICVFARGACFMCSRCLNYCEFCFVNLSPYPGLFVY